MTAKWDMVVYETDHMLHSFHGSFSLSPHKREIPGFKHFLKTANPSQYPQDFYFSILWIAFLNCSPPGSLCGKIGVCLPNISLETLPGNLDIMTISDSSYFIYNAVHVLARVLHTVILEKMEMRSPEDENQPEILPWQVNLQTRGMFWAHVGLHNYFIEVQHHDYVFILKSEESGRNEQEILTLVIRNCYLFVKITGDRSGYSELFNEKLSQKPIFG